MGVRGRPRDRRDLGWGLLLVGGAAAGAWADARLPWLAVAGRQGFEPRFWADLVRHGPVAYERFLLWAPQWAWAFLFLLGAALVALALSPPRRVRQWRAAAWLTALVPAYLLLWVGLGWLGIFLARLLETGPAPLRLMQVPYVHLGAGAALALLGLWKASHLLGSPFPSRRHRWPMRGALAMAWLFAVTLLALPLLPYATASSQGVTLHFDETLLAVVAGNVGGDAALAARDLEGFRLATLAGLGLSLGAVGWAWGGGERGPRRDPSWLRRHHAKAAWLGVPAVAAQGAFAALLVRDLALVAPGATWGPNPVPQAAALAGLILLVLQQRQAAALTPSGRGSSAALPR